MTDDTDKPQRDERGNFLPGNLIWKNRPRAGLFKKFETPEALWEACEEVITWYHENPLFEAKIVNGKMEEIPKMRALTLRGLCAFIGVTHRSWDRWKNEDDKEYRADLRPIIDYVEELLFQSKVEGAAAGLLHANLVARLTGLADKKDLSNTDGSLKPPREVVFRGVEPNFTEDDE